MANRNQVPDRSFSNRLLRIEPNGQRIYLKRNPPVITLEIKIPVELFETALVRSVPSNFREEVSLSSSVVCESYRIHISAGVKPNRTLFNKCARSTGCNQGASERGRSP